MPLIIRLPLILILVLLLLVGAFAGIASSESGTRWIATRAVAWMGDTIQWQSLEGSLFGPLKLSGVRVSQPGLEVEIVSLSFDWQPAGLAVGQFQLDHLSIDGARIRLSPAQPSGPSEVIDPSSLQLPVDLNLSNVRLRDLLVIQADGSVVDIDELKLDARLENGELAIQQLVVSLAGGGATLSGNTALSNPMPVNFQLDWHWALAVGDAGTPATEVPLSGLLSLEGKLHWSEAIGFDLSYRADAGGLGGLNPALPSPIESRGQLRGQYRGDEVALEQFGVSVDKSTLAVQGKVSLEQGAEPLFDMSLQWSDLQWPLAMAAPQFSSAAGKVDLSGRANDYQFEVALDVVGAEIPSSHWSARGRGDLSSLELDALRSNVLAGELIISGLLQWDPIPSWALLVEGSGLDPAQIDPELSGQLAIELRSVGSVRPEKGVYADIALKQLSGTLLDYPLKLKAEAVLDNESLMLKTLALESENNELSATGLLSTAELALDWQLLAGNPGALLAGASGQLKGSGKLLGSAAVPRLQATLQGSELVWESYSISTLTAVLDAGMNADDKLKLDVTIDSVADSGEPLLDALKLKAQGTSAKHSISLDLATTSEQLKLRLDGGVNEARTAWQGKLAHLGIDSEQYGTWSLSRASLLSLSVDAISLGNSCMEQSSSSAKLCIAAQRTEEAGTSFKAAVSALPVAMFAPAVSGEINGKIQAGLAQDGAILADAKFELSPGQIDVEREQGVKKLPHGGGALKVNIGGKGLASKLSFAAPERGTLDASLRLPAMKTWPMADRQPVEGHLIASLPDLSTAAAWIAELSSSAGQLRADLQLQGTVAKPVIIGEVALTQGAATIPMAGLELKQIEFYAQSNPAKLGQLELSGGLVSGPGRADVSGLLDINTTALALQLRGDRLKVFDTPDARVLLSPDIELGWRDDTFKARGTLLIPEADITPTLGVEPGMNAEESDGSDAALVIIAPSRDVILVNLPEDQAAKVNLAPSPFRIDSKIQVLLGDKVKVNTLGFISQIAGAVTFTNRPENSNLIPMAKGKLTLDDGTFRAFGQDLVIETGQIIFSDVPATEPELNVRAVRWIDSDPAVTAAGVLITGSASEPNLELFSRPELDATEIQSYLLTGRSSGDKSNVLSIGTYISPRFYVGYGYNLIQNTNEFNSLFSVTPRYGIGANLGEADNNINATITYEN